MSLRRVKEADLPTIKTFLDDINGEVVNQDLHPDFKKYETAEGSLSRIYEVDGKIVGWISIWPSPYDGWKNLHVVYVITPMRGQGIATTMMKYAQEQFRLVERVSLRVIEGGPMSLEALIKFYQKFGFRLIDGGDKIIMSTTGY